MHLRRKIIEELQEQLKTLPSVGKVRNQRLAPKTVAHRDIILYDTEENTDALTVHSQPREQDRALTIIVTAYILGQLDDEKVERDMDEIALDIETVMDCPIDADDIRLLGTDKTVAEDDPSINMVTLTYRLEYNTVEFDAEV